MQEHGTGFIHSVIKTFFRPVANCLFYQYQIPVHDREIMVFSTLATLPVRPEERLLFRVWITGTAMYQNDNKKNYAI